MSNRFDPVKIAEASISCRARTPQLKGQAYSKKCAAQLDETAFDAAIVADGGCCLDALCRAGLAVERKVYTTGLDVTEDLLKIAECRTSSAMFYRGYIEELPFDNCAFDALMCTGTGTGSAQIREKPG